jgi:hypothetical protein
MWRMKVVVRGLQWLIRLLAVVQLTLGVLFWTGNAESLIPLHMLTGVCLVLGLWVQAGLAARAGIGWGLPGLALVWGVVVVALGMTQAAVLPGDLHWLVQVLHLLVGLGAIGQAESLATRTLRRRSQIAPAYVTT